MKNTKILSIFMVIVFLASVHGTAASSSISIDQGVNIKVAVVYSTGGLGDQSFNDAAKAGISKAAAIYGANFTYDEACASGCTTTTDITTAIGDFAASATSYDLIIGVGFSATDGINASAQAYPGKDFMLIDAVVNEPNVVNVVFKEEEGSFLAGALAGMVTQTDKVAFLGGLPIPLIDRFYAGYSHGAQYVNPATVVSGTYSPDSNNPWGDLAGGQSVGETFLSAGNDIIFSAAGGTGIGVINAVAAANDLAGSTVNYAIGVDSDQDFLSPGDVLTSMVKRVDLAILDQVALLFGGSWAGGLVVKDVADGGVGLSNMDFTSSVLAEEYQTGITIGSVIADIKAKIINGEITVAENLTAVDTLLTSQGTYEVLRETTIITTNEVGSTITSVQTNTVSNQVTLTTSVSDELPMPVISTFIALFIAIPLIRRRK